MMYKDKDRQREAVRDATRRYRLKRKGITSITLSVIPKSSKSVIPSQSYNPMMVGYVPPGK